MRQAARDIGAGHRLRREVRRDARAGQGATSRSGTQLSVNSTPTFFINGVKIEGACAPQYFDQAIAYELQQRSDEAASADADDMLRLHATPCARHLRAHQGLRVGFWRKRPYRALDRLTLEVEPGEVFGFLGPERRRQDHHAQAADAAGVPDRRAAPRSSGGRSAISRVKRRIGYLPENPYFYDYLTAEELLTYFAGAVRLSRRRAPPARVGRLLDEVGIGAERRLQLRKFSKGMLQRVGIAQALINDPELVIFDEPMSGLDPLGRRDVRALILRLRDRGCTVFFSSHVLSDAEALCSRVAILAERPPGGAAAG